MTSGPSETSGAGLIGARQATGVGVAALLSAAVSYLTLVVAAHSLGAAENAVFLAFWGLLFGTYGVLTGVNPEAARAAFVDPGRELVASSGRRIVPAAIGFATVLCLVLVASSTVWADRLTGRGDAWLVLVVAVAGVAMSGHLAVGGVLAGRGEWRGMALLTTWEALVRLVAVGVAVAVSRSLAGLAVASAVSSVAWLLLLGRREVSRSVRAHTGAALGTQLARFAHACAASAASAALVVGFPVLIRLTSTPSEYAGAAPLLLAVSLTRAPLLVPLNAYQGVAMHYFLQHRDRGARALLPLAGALVAVTALAAALATVVGPWLFTLVLGPRYAVSGALLGLLTAGAGTLGLLTLTGASCLAIGGHRSYALGWVLATVTAVLVLMTPLDLQPRTVLSLLSSSLVGVVVHLGAISAASRRSRDAATASEDPARG